MHPEPVPCLVINLLGSFDVRLGGEAVLGWRSEKTKWLLAYLVLNPGAATYAALQNALGMSEGTDPKNALSNVRQSLANLGDLLGRERFLKPTRSSVLLNLDAVQTDVLAFDTDVQATEIAALQRAVALYRGPLLPGCHEAWAAVAREIRAQQYAEALHKLTVDALASGDWDAAESYLRLRVAADPLKEEIRSDLMRLLLRRGERNAASKVYQDLMDLLRDDPKAQPGAAIRHLYQTLRSAPDTKADFPVERPLHAHGNYPAPLSTLIGREKMLREVGARLFLERLVTLTGPPGVGKTQLALHTLRAVAPDCPDGVWFLDLSDVDSRRGLLRKLIAMLELRTQQHSEEEALLAFFTSTRSLLVLDNCEHLLQACAPLVRDLLSQCPWLHVLTTSRQPLEITGESVYAVMPLALPTAGVLTRPGDVLVTLLPEFSAVQLFLKGARNADPVFALKPENAHDVAQLCSKVEGLPLALEMAAAWSDLFTPAEIVSRLSDVLTTSVNVPAPGPTRHGSLAAAIGVSYTLLPLRLQRLFAHLSIFSGGWTLEAATSVFPETATLPELRQLQQRSLVTAAEAGATKRFRFLEPVREFAQGQVTERERVLLAPRHAGYFLQLAEQAEPFLKGPEQGFWLQRMEQERANFQAALAWTCQTRETEIGLRIAAALGRFWQVRAYYAEGQAWLQRLLEADTKSATTVRLKALQVAGNLAFHSGDYPLARHWFRALLHLGEMAGDRRGMAVAAGNLANIASEEGDLAQARAGFEQCLDLFRDLGDAHRLAFTLGNLAVVACREGNFALGCVRHEESIAAFEQVGDWHSLAMAYNNLADVKLSLSLLAEAWALLRKSLALSRKLDSIRTLVHTLSLLCGLAAQAGDAYHAAVLLGSAQALRTAHGMPMAPQAHATMEAVTKEIKARLTDCLFEQALRQGSALSREDAVAFALQVGNAMQPV